jgi:hypothetical protein
MKDAKDAKPAPISMGIIVNFTKNTVQGFGIPGVSDYPVKIRGMNDARIVFDGSHDNGTSVASTTGSIDRVTGDVEATDILSHKNRQCHAIDKLRAEMQASTTDVLRV